MLLPFYSIWKPLIEYKEIKVVPNVSENPKFQKNMDYLPKFQKDMDYLPFKCIDFTSSNCKKRKLDEDIEGSSLNSSEEFLDQLFKCAVLVVRKKNVHYSRC